MRGFSFILTLLLSTHLALGGTSFFGGGAGGSSGDFENPVITGTSVDFFDSLLKIEDGGDRSVFKGDVLEFRDTDNDPILHLHGTDAHRQVTTLNADIWFEPGAGGSREGDLVWYNRVGRIGWSVQQQDDLPGWHHPADIGLSNGLHFVATSEATTETLTSDHARILYSGTKAAANQTLQMLGVDYFKINNTGGTRYIENHLGNGGVYKTQQNVDAWINDAKFVSYSSTAAKARVGDATLVNGTVTVTNTNNDANDRIFPSLKTPGGTLCAGVKWSINAGVSFTLTAVQADGTTCTTDTSTYSWWIINKQ